MKRLFMVGSWLALAGALAAAPDPIALAERSAELLATVERRAGAKAAAVPEAPRLRHTVEGYVRSLSAPAEQHFPSGMPAPVAPALAARAFLQRHAAAFGVANPAVDFTTLKDRARQQRRMVKFAQTYRGLPVFAAQVILQLNAENGIEFGISDLARDTAVLDAGQVALQPRLTAAEAQARGVTIVRDGGAPGPLTATANRLVLYVPSVLGNQGATRLTWEVDVYGQGGSPIGERVLIDAATRESALQYSLHHSARNRRIYDWQGTATPPLFPARTEGGAATGIAAVDDAYTFLRHTYDFYQSNHGRDSYDDNGAVLDANVRYCEPFGDCPLNNAYWSTALASMYFGAGWVSDDIVAHELTHGVTWKESDLVYQNISGAINESFSDIWGEFVDLTNGAGDDSPSVRWLVGEDRGAIRDMRDPTQFGDPDWRGSDLYYTGSGDNGGVHRNSGVNNKLCYLLTDGDTFRGYTVRGLGMGRVVDLYYEANTELLTSGADWDDLYDALVQAARNLSWSVADRNNLYLATRAVGIADRDVYYVNVASACPEAGAPQCLGGFLGPFRTTVTAYGSSDPGDRLVFFGGNYPKALNTPVVLSKILTLTATNGNAVIGRP